MCALRTGYLTAVLLQETPANEQRWDADSYCISAVLVLTPVPSGSLHCVNGCAGARAPPWQSLGTRAPLKSRTRRRGAAPRLVAAVCNRAACSAGPQGCARSRRAGSAGGWGRRRETTVASIVIWDTAASPPSCAATVDSGAYIWALAVLPDGQLTAGCSDGEVRVVDVAAAAVVATLVGHTRGVVALAVLPDGRPVSGSEDTTVRVWDVARRVCGAMLAGRTDVRLWDVRTRTCTAVLVGHTADVYALVALSDGRLVSGSHYLPQQVRRSFKCQQPRTTKREHTLVGLCSNTGTMVPYRQEGVTTQAPHRSYRYMDRAPQTGGGQDTWIR